MLSTATAGGRGKLIVFGEHSVVYGRPAVACSLDRGTTARLSPTDQPHWSIRHPGGKLDVDDDIHKAGLQLLKTFNFHPNQLRIDIDIELPVGVGLGSSAAMAVAIARAAADLRKLHGAERRSAIDEAVSASETVFHGTPSGIDQHAASGEAFFSFRKTDGDSHFESIDAPAHTWLIARVAPPSSTAAMVKSVRRLQRRRPDLFDALLDNFGMIAEQGIEGLDAGDWETVGELMDVNQGLLNTIGVSTSRLEAACHTAREAGAFGAKLTGAGGGGCIVALPAESNTDQVAEALEEHGDVFKFSLPPGK